MTAVIRLDELLHETVAVRSRNLVTRPTGVAIRDRLLLQMRAEPGETYLDFSQIGVVDFSCADEVVAKLLVAIVSIESMPMTRLLLRGVHPHHADAIDHALERQGLTVIALMEDGTPPCLLGLVSEDTRSAFRALHQCGLSTALLIAEILSWTPARAHDALADLVQRRCAFALPDDSFELGVVT